MHELSIAQEILATSQAATSGHAGAQLERVKVAVGELTAIEPELLRFAWEALVEGTAEAGCVLDVEWRPARQHCPQCQEDKARPAHGWLPMCADCGAVLRVEGGQELDLLQVSFNVPDGSEEAGDDGNG